MKLGKLALVGLTAILAFGATACGSSTANGTSSTKASSATAESAAGSSDAADTSADSTSSGEVQKVLIGIRQDLYPTSYINEQGEPAGYDIELVEKHHNQKLDAPSGTALALADSINDALNNEYNYVYDRSQVRQKRDSKEIGISAVRAGTIVGEHEVIFAGIDEVIEFKHTAYSRSVFGKGAVEAAKYLAGKPAGMYDMSDVIAF